VIVRRSVPFEDLNLMLTRLINNWVYGGAMAGLLFLLLLPALASGWSLALLAVVLQLPAYMLHQYEEHDDDRFRQFFNRTMFGGREVLSRAAVFVINVPGVWGVIAVSIYLARFVDIGFGLIAVYLVLVNALVHVIHALVFRSYNPGLATAVGIFLPVGGYGLWQIDRAGGGNASLQALGIGSALVIHAAIIAYAKHKSGSSSLAVGA